MPKPIDLGRSISVSTDPYGTNKSGNDSTTTTTNSGGGTGTTSTSTPATPTDGVAGKIVSSTAAVAVGGGLVNEEAVETLRGELGKLQKQLDEEKWNSKQAAEYGLTLLEDNKKLQSRNYELEAEIESVKAELDSTNLVGFLSCT